MVEISCFFQKHLLETEEVDNKDWQGICWWGDPPENI